MEPESTTTTVRSPVLECRGVVKRFPGVLALDEVDLEIRRGEIHALVGQNGAGKSTLVKIITGVYELDAGEILLDGEHVDLAGPVAAAEHGIAIVHQDSPLVAQFDVTRNAFLGHEIVGPGGILDFDRMRTATEAALELVGAQFGAGTLIRDLSVGQREQVAITAALVQKPSILILDEPTASLGAEEVERLFSIIRSLQATGVTIIYISHHLDEIFNLASRITVLRDGRRAGTYDIGSVKRAEIIHQMVGRELSQLYPKQDLPIGEALLEVSGLRQGRSVRSVDFTLHHGEILGIAGLVGAGRTETALTLFGALSRTGGEVLLDGQSVNPRSPHAAKKAGLALIPEDRRAEGLITDLSVKENLTLANLPKWSTLGVIGRRSERSAAAGLVESLGISTPTIDQITRNLSGGNQQKVVIGRWLATDAKVYIFDEPTTGVDVGSKVEIYREMTQIAANGAGVIFISSDFEELVEMCDRVVVIKKGEVVREFARGEADERIVMQWATGATDEDVDDAAGTAATGLSVTRDQLPDQGGSPDDPAAAGRHSASRLRLMAWLTRWGALVGMLLAIGVMAIGAPEFLAPANIFVVLKQGSILALIAISLTIVLIAGGLDMSAGAISQLTANLAAGVLIAGSSVAIAFASGLAVGLGFGLLNTFFVVVIGMSPFVSTLGAMFIAIGASFAYNGGQALTLYDEPVFFFFGQGQIGPIPFVLIIVVVLTLVLQFFLKRTRTGLRMYSVGENLAAAQLRGISQRKALTIAFMLHGLLVGVSGVLLASYSYGASALATGLDFLISAFAAAFLGSVLSRTGELDVAGAVVAAMFITSINNGLILNGVSNLVLPGIQGAILIASILVGVVRRRDIGQMTIF